MHKRLANQISGKLNGIGGQFRAAQAANPERAI
jgi:hypothetical protein